MPRVQIPTRRINQFLRTDNDRVIVREAKRVYYRDKNKKWIGVGWTGRARYEILDAAGRYLRTEFSDFIVLDSQLPD